MTQTPAFPLPPAVYEAYRREMKADPVNAPNGFWPRSDWEWWVRDRFSHMYPGYRRAAKRCRQFRESLYWRCAQDKRNRERGIVTVWS